MIFCKGYAQQQKAAVVLQVKPAAAAAGGLTLCGTRSPPRLLTPTASVLHLGAGRGRGRGADARLLIGGVVC